LKKTSKSISKNNFFLNSLSPEISSPIPQTPIEESNLVTLISVSSFADVQQSNSFPSDIIDENPSNTPTAAECLPNNEPTMFIVTSPSINSDLSSEQNDAIKQLSPSSFSFLQTKQRPINHRRNKSEPVKSASTEDLPSTTNSENLINEPRRKSSTKLPSNNTSPSTIIKQISQEKSSATSRKKKSWYNVSAIYHLSYLDRLLSVYCYLYVIHALYIFFFFSTLQ
jgi:hypothetical protein